MANGLNSEIDYWIEKLANQNKDDELYLRMVEMAFFKIFVKFEDLLTFKFKKYCIGTGNGEYIPERKLNFTDISHLEGVLKSGRTSYVDLSKIQEVSKHIFEKDPFGLIFNTFHEELSKMKYIRNYIAHESEESKNKYCRYVLEVDESRFISPGNFLIKIPRGRETSNFDFFINEIRKQREIIMDPTPYLR